MTEYFVSFNCIWSTTVIADNPEQAADLAEAECPCDIDGFASVTNLETNEYFDEV